MNAGNLSVSVEADMKALDAQFAAIEKAFSDAGNKAAAAFKQATTMSIAKDGPSGAADEIVDLLADPVKDGVKVGVDAGVKAAIPATSSSATALGKSLGEKASKSMAPTLGDRLKNEFGEQKLGKMLGAAIGLGAVDNMIRSMASVLRGDQTIGEAIAASIKSLPVIGAIAELGEAISQAVFVGDPEGDARRRMQQNKDEATMLLTQTNARLDADQLVRDKAAEHQKYIARLRHEDERLLDGVYEKRQQMIEQNTERNADLAAKVEIERAKLAGDEILALEIERDRALEREREDRKKNEVYLHELNLEDKLGAENLKWEMDNLDKAHRQRLRIIEAEYQLEIDLQAIKNDEDRQQKREAFEEEKAKTLELLDKKREKMLDETEAEVRRASRVGSVSTAIGEFKFSAYSDAEKKRLDTQAVDTLRRILDNIAAQRKATEQAVFT